MFTSLSKIDALSVVNNAQFIRVLAFGDSLTAGTSPPDYNLYPYSAYLEATLKRPSYDLPAPIIVRHKGFPGWTASQLLEYAPMDGGLENIIDSIQNPPLSLILILAGANDLAYENNKDKILNSIIDLHHLCHDKDVPHTIALAIPPSGYQTKVHSVFELAHTINDSLREYCDKRSDFMTYFPFPFEFQRGDDRWCSDGLHFTKKGYQELAESLAPVVSHVIKTRILKTHTS